MGKQYLLNFQTASGILHALEKPQALLNMLGLFCPTLVSAAELKLAFFVFFFVQFSSSGPFPGMVRTGLQ